MSDLTTQPKAWHTLHSKEGLAQLGVDPAGGLSSPDVDQRLKQYGPNVMTETKEEPLWLQFVKQYKDYMRIVLTIAAVASFIVGDFSTGVILLIITAGNAYLALNQERKAGESVAALNSMMQATARVRRDGQTVEIHVEEIVPMI